MAGSPSVSRLARVLPVAAAALLLAGCSLFSPKPSASHTPSDAPSTSQGSTPSESPSTTPSSTPTPTPTPTPVTLSCAQIWTDQQVFDDNPNFTPADHSAASGTLAAQLVTQQRGVACGWENGTSKSIIEVAVAEPDPAQLKELSGTAAESYQVVPTYGTGDVTGYFLASAHTAQVFTKKYWVVVDCKDWLEPGDAAIVVSDVLKNLS